MIYNPIKLGKNIITLERTGEWKECLEYAINHNFDVLYEDVKNTDAVMVMYNFQKNGFRIDLSEIDALKTNGSSESKVICRFIRK